MKKFFAVFLTVVMTFALVGCGGDSSSTGEIDLDLTELSSTMVYSEVSNIMTTPDDYIGQTVKMNGTFASYYDEQEDEYFFACVIADATACCQQGLEFQLKGDHKYPDDYPEVGDEITIVGTFDTYDLNGQTYATLKDAELQ